MSDSHAARTMRELFRIVFLRSGRILLFVALVTVGTWFLCGYWTPSYRSSVTLIFKQPATKSPIFQESPERSLEVFVKAQQQIVMSELVLARTKVISENPKLRETWYSLRDRFESLKHRRTVPSEPYDAKAGAELDAARKAIDDFLNRSGAGGVADGVKALMGANQRALKEFGDDVKLKTPGGEQVAMTESFQIVVDRPRPEGASDGHLAARHAADILADMYIVRFREYQESLYGSASEFMKKVIEEHDRVVDAAGKRLNDFVEHELDSPGDVAILEQLLKSGTEHGFQIIATRAREQSLRLMDELAKSKSIRTLLKSFLPKKAFEPGGVDKMADPEIASATAVIPPEVMEANILVNRLTSRLIQVQSRLAQLETTFTDENPALRDTRAELMTTRRHVLAEMVAHARSLDITIDSLQSRLKDNESNLNGVEGRLDKINRKLTEYTRLKNDVAVAQKQHQDLREQQIAAFTSDERARASITIEKLDQATTPDPAKPAQPRQELYTIIMGIVSLLLAIALAFLGDHFDHTLRTIDQAERYLGVPVVGSVSRQGRNLLTSA